MEETVHEDNKKFLAVLGEDRGCRLNITNSTFKNSNFCKGMITYRRQESISFSDEPNLLNFTAQYNRTAEDELETDRRDP